MKQQTVGMLIFDEVEVLDFCGPYEVFTIAELYEYEKDNRNRHDGQEGDRNVGEQDGREEFSPFSKPFRVVTIAANGKTVRCRGGLLVHPLYTTEDHPPLDILVIPGGKGTLRVLNNTEILDWIAGQYEVVSLTVSVCTGAFLLAARGLLDDRSATTHWGGIEPMRHNYPSIDVREDARYVDSGDIITSAGVSAGIDAALYVVQRLLGEEVARQTARRMEYQWLERGSPLGAVV